MTDMENKKILDKLQNAQSPDERDWMVMQFSLKSLSPALRDMVWAAAIPHWFDADFLATILGKPLKNNDFLSLTRLSFIEVYSENSTYNVHEKTRSILLQKLWKEDRGRYRLFSQHAAAYCLKQDQNDAIWKIETIYHFLIGFPDKGVDLLISTGWEWQNSPHFAFNRVEALVKQAREHADSSRLTELGNIWTLFWEARLDYLYCRFPDAINKLLQIKLSGIPNKYTSANVSKLLGTVYITLNKNNEARKCIEEARSIFCELGDRLGEANCIASLGDVHRAINEDNEARKCIEEARSIFCELGNQMGEANCLFSLGNLFSSLNKNEEARKCLEEARHIYSELGNRHGKTKCNGLLGYIHLSVGEYEEARKCLEEARIIFSELGDRLGEANCISSLGNVHRVLHEYEEARKYLEEARSIYCEIGNRNGKINCIHLLGNVHLGLCEYAEARKCLEEARIIFSELGDRLGEVNCISSLANVHLALGEYEEARKCFEEARIIFSELGDRLGEANCIASLGIVHKVVNKYEEARKCLEASIEIFDQIKSPKAEVVKTWLAGLSLETLHQEKIE